MAASLSFQYGEFVNKANSALIVVLLGCCCSIYIMGLVFDWLVEQGGCESMAKRNIEKVNLLYDLIDSSNNFYQ